MIRSEGYYYDGKSSARIPVSITFFRSGQVRIEGPELSLETNLNHLSIAARLGDTRRSIFLPGGAKLEIADNDAIDRVCRDFRQNRFHTLLHHLERHWRYVVLALAISGLFVWAGIEYGVPLAAKWTASAVPRDVEEEMGEQGLASLDGSLFTPSKLPSDRQATLQRRFMQLPATSQPGYRYRLLFRGSRQMGANAMALPGGFIVVTDALVRLAEHDEQILAVLAHEMGHIEYQHGLRSVLQDSLTALFMAGLLGDITSVSSLSATLPAILVESRYSREFEFEADAYAVKILLSRQIGIHHLVRILTLLEHAGHTSTQFDYLSSHPAMDKRIARIESLRKKR